MNGNGNPYCPNDRGRKRDRVSPFCRITGKSHSMDEHHYTPSPDNYPRLEMQPCCRITEKNAYFKDYHYVYPIIDNDGVTRVITEHDFHCRITAKYRAMAGHKYIYPILGASNDKTVKDMESVVDHEFYRNVLIPHEVEKMIRGGIKDVKKLKDNDYIFIHSNEGSLFPAALRDILPKRTKEYGKYSRRHTMPVALEAQISLRSRSHESLQLRMIKELKKQVRAPPEDFSVIGRQMELLKDVRKTRPKKPRRIRGQRSTADKENVRRLSSDNGKVAKRVKVKEEIVSKQNGELNDVIEEDCEMEVKPVALSSRFEKFKLQFQNFEVTDSKASKNMLVMVGAFDPNDVVELDFSEGTTEPSDNAMEVDFVSTQSESTVCNSMIASEINPVLLKAINSEENTSNGNIINEIEKNNSELKINEAIIYDDQKSNTVQSNIDNIDCKNINKINDGVSNSSIDHIDDKIIKNITSINETVVGNNNHFLAENTKDDIARNNYEVNKKSIDHINDETIKNNADHIKDKTAKHTDHADPDISKNRIDHINNDSIKYNDNVNDNIVRNIDHNAKNCIDRVIEKSVPNNIVPVDIKLVKDVDHKDEIIINGVGHSDLVKIVDPAIGKISKDNGINGELIKDIEHDKETFPYKGISGTASKLSDSSKNKNSISPKNDLNYADVVKMNDSIGKVIDNGNVVEVAPNIQSDALRELSYIPNIIRSSSSALDNSLVSRGVSETREIEDDSKILNDQSVKNKSFTNCEALKANNALNTVQLDTLQQTIPTELIKQVENAQLQQSKILKRINNNTEHIQNKHCKNFTDIYVPDTEMISLLSQPDRNDGVEILNSTDVINRQYVGKKEDLLNNLVHDGSCKRDVQDKKLEKGKIVSLKSKEKSMLSIDDKFDFKEINNEMKFRNIEKSEKLSNGTISGNVDDTFENKLTNKIRSNNFEEFSKGIQPEVVNALEQVNNEIYSKKDFLVLNGIKNGVVNEQIDTTRKIDTYGVTQKQTLNEQSFEKKLSLKKLKTWQSIEFDPESLANDDLVKAKFENAILNSNVTIPKTNNYLLSSDNSDNVSNGLDEANGEKISSTGSNIPQNEAQAYDIPKTETTSMEGFKSRIQNLKDVSKSEDSVHEIRKTSNPAKCRKDDDKCLILPHVPTDISKLSVSLKNESFKNTESLCNHVKELNEAALRKMEFAEERFNSRESIEKKKHSSNIENAVSPKDIFSDSPSTERSSTMKVDSSKLDANSVNINKLSRSAKQISLSDGQSVQETANSNLAPSLDSEIYGTKSKIFKEEIIDIQYSVMAEEDMLRNSNTRLPVTYSLMLKNSSLPVEVSTENRCQGLLDDSFGHRTTIQHRVVSTDKRAKWDTDFKTVDVYMAIMDFHPMESDDESVPMKEGQQVEVIDATKPRRWLVRTVPQGADENPLEGWVPACYLEKSTAEQTISNFAAAEIARDAKEVEAIENREAVVRELVETEEDFSKDMQFVVENYYKRLDDSQVPKELRDRKGSIFGNFKDISDFHNNVLMKGVCYHANEPTKLGKIFLRLERDFDMHANYCWNEARAQRILKDQQLKSFFEGFSQTIGDDKTIIDHLKLPIQRLNDYQLLLKEIIKYSSRLDEDTNDLQKALDFIHSINKRTKDLQSIQSIQGCQGDLLKLGRIIKLEPFDVIEDSSSMPQERQVFLFKGRVILTDKTIAESGDEVFHAANAFKLQDVEICENVPDDARRILFRHSKKNRVGFPFHLQAKTSEQKETWLKDVNANIQVTEDLGEEEPVVVRDVLSVTKKEQPEAAAAGDLKHRIEESGIPDSNEPQQKKSKTDDKESVVDKKEEVSKSKERKSSIKRQVSLKKEVDDSGSTDTKEEKPLQRRQSVKRQDSQSKKKKSIGEDENIAGTKAELPPRKSSDTAVKRQKSLDKAQKDVKGESEDKANKDISLPISTDTKSQQDSIKTVKRQDSADKPKSGSSEKVGKDKGETKDNQELIRLIPPVRIMSEDLSECEGRLDDLESVDTCDDNATIVSGSFRSGGSPSPPLADDAAMSDKPSFVKALRGVTCGVGEKATLECETGGNPVPSVTWLKDNQRISKSKKITTSSKGQTHSLTIKETSPEDGGLYTVVANNSQGSASCSALLNLKLSLLGLPKEDSRPSTPGGTILPHAPVFKVKLNKETQLLEGTCVRFELVVRGNPEPTVKFLKDGKELKQDDRVRVAYENKEIFELILDHVSIKDAGTYACEASNHLGSDTTTGKLCVVKTKDVFKGLDLEEERSPTPRPRTPKFKWFKDGQDFEASERFQVIFNEEEDSLALMFQHVTPEDAGLYTCVASTSTGSKIACSAELTVQGVVREVEAPAIKAELSDVEATEGGSAMLELKITGYPKPKVTWFHKNKEVATGGRYRFLFADEETFTLVIKNVKKDDSGAYSVKAVNEIGTAESSCQLSVKSAPSFSKGLKDKSVMAEDLLAFEIEVDGTPPPDVKWYKDGQQLKPDDRTQIVDDGKKKFGLKISKAKQGDSGSYSCVLTNPLGSQAEFSNVVVKASPTFVKEMENIDGLEGESLHFTVEVNGNPKPTLKWSKDGKELKVDGKHIKVIEEGINAYSLAIENASPADVGAYTCELRNEHGLKASSGNLAIKTKPEFVKKLSDIEANQGDTGVTLATTVKGYPPASVKWLFDGKDLSENKNCTITSDLTSLSKNMGSYTLKLKKVDCNMAGKYTCEATNEMGSATSVGALTVKVVNRKPEFSQSLQPTQLVEGKPGKLVAKVIGEPRPKIQWLKDGKPIRLGDHFKVEEDPDGTISLLLDEVSSSDAGTYSIVATSDEGEAKCDAAVTTIPPGRKPEFLKELDETTVMESKPLCLTAKVTGKPTSIKWQKDGKDLSPNDKITIKEDPDGSVSLKIGTATVNDAGKYVVIASNAEGKARSVALVEVKACSMPSIDSFMKPLTLADGETGKLKLKVSGEPKPTLQWLKDGKPLKMSNRVDVSEEPDGTMALTINNARPEDAGKYTVIAENHMGSVESSAPVDVNQAPTFQKQLGPVDVVEGYPAKLEAKLSGSPPPEIKWMKDGKGLTPDGDHIKEVRSPDGTVALLIENCKPEDAAKYSLVAKNSLGEKESNGSLAVSSKKAEGEPESVPSFVGPLNDVSVKEGEPIRFEAKISGNPLPDISWTLNGENIKPSDSKLITFDGKNAILDIKNSSPEDGGTYQCIISNPLGKASSEGAAAVQGKTAPRFVQQLTDYTGIMGNPLILSCRVKGFPEPDIDWYFNGKPIPSTSKYSMTKAGDLLCLSINSCQPEDSAVFECRASNALGEDRTRSAVNVSDKVEKGEPPMFLKKIGDCEVMEGMTAKFTACVTGIPTPDVKWAKDGKPLELSSRHKSELEATGILRMIIRDVDPADYGEYSVAISNPLGSATSSAHIRPDSLDQKYISPMGDQFVGFDKFKQTGAPVPLPDKPRILRMSDDALTLGWKPSIPNAPRTPVTYQVEMSKHPGGEYEPYKSGLKDTSCDVRGLTPGQDYKFRIRVENDLGLSEPSPYTTAHRSKLVEPISPANFVPKDYEIEHPPLEKLAAAPRFLRKEEDSMYGVRGHPVSIEFWLYGHPEPEVSWYKDDVKIGKDKYAFMQDRGGKLLVLIDNMTDDYVGTYTCHAVNSEGEARMKIKLLIAEHPVFTQKLDETTAMVRRCARMQCKVTGVPYPKIKWFRDWHPLYESDRIKILWEEPDTCTLFLTNLITRDAGLFSCSASNIAGTATSSAALNVEDTEEMFDQKNYNYPLMVKPRSKKLEDFYDIGDELGRGTQSIVRHVVKRSTGDSYAAKMMSGRGKFKDFMRAEMNIMNEMGHQKLVRLYDALETPTTLDLITDICAGGELLDNILKRGTLTEREVAYYIKQLLEGLEHMHGRFIGHLGLTVGDLLVSRVNSYDIKVGDFGLSAHLIPGKDYFLEYGHPEFVAPEIANKQPATLMSDMWSVGVITYLLLSGLSPFLGPYDRETLTKVKEGKINFSESAFSGVTDDAKDFMSKLLVFDSSGRMNVKNALQHKWIKDYANIPTSADKSLDNIDRLKEYYKKWKDWYANASCKTCYRRRTLESCFHDPSRMIYPPGECYTPETSPERELKRPPVKPFQFDDITYQQKINREDIDFRSESHYQNGPDTYLLQLRDPDFPLRLRQYLRVGARTSPSLAANLRDTHWGDSTLVIRERRKFVDVMDEEIGDEKRGLSTRTIPMRLHHEIGTLGYAHEQMELLKKEVWKDKGSREIEIGLAPFFREKIQDIVMKEDDEIIFRCYAVGTPKPKYIWFRNDGILLESSRIAVSELKDGHCEMRIKTSRAYDVGVYKCVARNDHGFAVCRARLKLGGKPGRPEPPVIREVSDTEIYVTWSAPKDDGKSPALCYSLEYKQSVCSDWTVVASNITHEYFVIRNLLPSLEYQFRVKAYNKFGWGEPGFPTASVATKVEGAEKVKISPRRKFQQELTEQSSEYEPDEIELTDYDYNIESNPIPIAEGEMGDFYRIVSEMDRGRFSVVLNVWVKESGTTSVAKVIQSKPGAQSDGHQEYEILKSLCHERIVTLFSASFKGDKTVLVMEKLSGVDILTYMSSKQDYNEEMVAYTIRQVLDAIGYLHFRGICYIELQPDNVVMIDQRQPDVKLVDFGSSRFVSKAGGKVLVEGTLEYLAPEIVKHEDVMTGTDVWGVGILTYILLSGVSPFHGANDQETADNVIFVRYQFDHLHKDVTMEATKFLLQIFKACPIKRPTVAECLENKWLAPSEYMIMKRESARFLPDKLSAFSKKFHTAKSEAMDPEMLTSLGLSSSKITVKDEDF